MQHSLAGLDIPQKLSTVNLMYDCLKSEQLVKYNDNRTMQSLNVKQQILLPQHYHDAVQTFMVRHT